MKKAYTIDQQIARLKSNGMAFDDEEKAKEILLDVGYYRLGFYSFPYEIKFPCLEHRNHKTKTVLHSKAFTTFMSLIPDSEDYCLTLLTVSRSIFVRNSSIIYRFGMLMTLVGLLIASM